MIKKTTSILLAIIMVMLLGSSVSAATSVTEDTYDELWLQEIVEDETNMGNKSMD